MKTKTVNNQVFNVPNTDEGKQLLKLAKKFINRPAYKIKVRGRGHRPSANYQGYLPHSMSSWFSVYVKNQRFDKKLDELVTKQWQKEDEILKLKHEIATLKEILAKKEVSKTPLIDAIPIRLPNDVPNQVAEVTITVKGANVKIVKAD